MDAATIARALDPFYTDGRTHPGRTVGLGLPFLAQLAEATGGELALASEPGQGTEVRLRVPANHPDVPPTGSVVDAFQQSLCYAGAFDMELERRYGAGAYRIVRADLLEALGELETVGSRSLLREFVASQEEGLR